MVLRPSAPCRVVGMEVKDLGLLRGHLARDSAPCPVAGTEMKYLGLLGRHSAEMGGNEAVSSIAPEG